MNLSIMLVSFVVFVTIIGTLSSNKINELRTETIRTRIDTLEANYRANLLQKYLARHS